MVRIQMIQIQLDSADAMAFAIIVGLIVVVGAVASIVDRCRSSSSSSESWDDESPNDPL